MNSLIKVEFKKLIKNKTVQIAFSLCIIYSLVALIGGIKSESTFKPNEDKNGVYKITGIEAIKFQRESTLKTKGYLDEKKIKDTINYYHKLKGNKDTISDYDWFKYLFPYEDIVSLIGNSYSKDINNTNYFSIIGGLNSDEANKFYKNRIDIIKNQMKINSLKENENVINSLKKLNTPIYYEYSGGWTNLLQNFFFLNLIIILIVCFSISIVCSKDFENEMILLVLSTVNGKTKLIVGKIKASILFTTITYFIVNIFYFVCLFSFYGYSGWNSYIQINNRYWLSIYNLKFYQTYLLGLGIGICVCIFMVMLTLLFVYIFKKSILSVSVSTSFLLVPILIDIKKTPNIITKIVEVLPVKVLNFTYILKQQTFYNIMGYSIKQGYVISSFFILASIIIIPLIIIKYKKLEAV